MPFCKRSVQKMSILLLPSMKQSLIDKQFGVLIWLLWEAF